MQKKLNSDRALAVNIIYHVCAAVFILLMLEVYRAAETYWGSAIAIIMIIITFSGYFFKNKLFVVALIALWGSLFAVFKILKFIGPAITVYNPMGG